MHIPDVYLSPQTCAVLYGAAVPFWAVALRRAKGLLGPRTIPVLALFSAFAFIIQMFNIPLPGGTTGHAVGGTLIAIILGPWAAVLGITVVLAIQALLFGDGGITSLGANVFNMAIAQRAVVLNEERRLEVEGTTGEILNHRELLERTNIIHQHRHRHGAAVHTHPHSPLEHHQHRHQGSYSGLSTVVSNNKGAA